MSENKNGIALALGTFDGFHLGHKKVIDNAIASNKTPKVLLFNEHPQKVITKKSPGELITESQKKELLDKRKERAQEVEKAFEKANKLLNEFLNDYGRYHTTITPERNWFDILFDLW